MIKTFKCKICNIEFEKKTRSYAYYCDDCRKEKRRRDAHNRAIKTGKIKKPGVGSGGNQWGENNHQWSNYSAEYSYRHIVKKTECAFCESKDNLLIHHKDFNRENNTEDNLVCVCRKCHSVLHNLIDNINSRSKTSLTQGNSRTDNPEPSHSNVEGATTNRDECNGVSLK